MLFNVYLEEALKKSETLWKKFISGSLLAYADDICVMAQSANELKTIIKELRKMEECRLHLNVSKCEILKLDQSPAPQEEVEGIQIKEKVKYLGMVIEGNKQQMKKT